MGRIAKLNEDFELPEQPEAGEDEIKKNLAKNGKQGPNNFKHFGEFLMAAKIASERHIYDARLVYVDDLHTISATDEKALAESIGASGGFLVPLEQSSILLGLLGEGSIVRQNATVMRMTRRQMTIPIVDQTSAVAGQPAWFGGMVASWTEEAGQKGESDPQFRQLGLTAFKLVVYTRVSDELLDDSATSLSDFLMGPMGFPGAIRWQEDFTFLRGTGAGQPLGVVPAPGTITVARQVAGPGAAAITFTDLTNMMENFLPSGDGGSGGNGRWVFSTTAKAELLRLQGPDGNPSFIWANAIDGAPNRLLGHPVSFTEKLATIGNVGDALLADFSFYIIGDRQNTTIDSSIHERLRNDQTTWRAVHRVDGRPRLSAPITLQDGTAQVSPFVILGAKTT